MARPRRGLETFHSAAPADWHSYRNRVNMFTKERVYRLSPKAVIIEERDKETLSVPYSEISSVHIRFVKTKYRTYLECELKKRAGKKFTFRSVNYSGFASFDDHESQFRNFIGELHEKLVAFPCQRDYRVGSAAMFIVSVIGAAAMVGMAVFAVLMEKWIVLVVPPIALYQLYPNITKGKPGTYDPRRLPDWVD